MGKRLTYEEIKNFIEIESNSNCELLTKKEDYINTHQNLTIKCKCTNVFSVDFHRFKSEKKHQCNECGRKLVNRIKPFETFKNQLIDLYGDRYLIINKNEYKDAITKIEIGCNICNNSWHITPHDILWGYGCPTCSGVKHKNTEEYKIEIYNLYKDRYTILDDYINAYTKIKTCCNNCGWVWSIKPNDLLSNHGCPKCASSKANIKIIDFCIVNKLDCFPEYKIKECKDKLPLPFDARIIINNSLLLVEADGKHHFEPVNFGGISDEQALKNFKITQYHDEIKNQYCQNNNIKLLRIPYWEFEKIDEMLNEYLIKF